MGESTLPSDETMLRVQRTAAPRLAASFDPMSGSWPMVLFNTLVAVGLTGLCHLVAESLADGAAAFVLFLGICTVVIFFLVAVPLRWFLMAQRRQADAREALLHDEGEKRAFEARLVRALEMAEDQPSALHVAVRAARTLAPQAAVEFLLADSSQAHLSQVAATEGVDGGHEGCAVSTPKGCPAVRNGHSLLFPDSESLDACPHLRNRARGELAAICIPISVMGAAVGVMHTTTPREVQLDERQFSGLRTVAQQLGGRIGLVNAMSQSQLQANTDPLTGLMNRRSLENEVRTLLRKDHPFAVVVADLDHFKQLNDTYGHDTGDRALRLFARVLGRSVRDNDITCRYGGEEFVLVLPELVASAANRIVDRVRSELEAALADARVPPFTVSAGIADTNDATTLEELINIADANLLRAKRNGRNQTVWTGFSEPLVPADARALLA